MTTPLSEEEARQTVFPHIRDSEGRLQGVAAIARASGLAHDVVSIVLRSHPDWYQEGRELLQQKESDGKVLQVVKGRLAFIEATDGVRYGFTFDKIVGFTGKSSELKLRPGSEVHFWYTVGRVDRVQLK